MTRRIRLVSSGRWSGGGSVVLRNFDELLRSRIDLNDPENGIPLYLRNIAPPRSLVGRNFLLLPQNAWPWSDVGGEAKEVARKRMLRLWGDASLRRAMTVIRISSAIPRTENATTIIPNVLDHQFEAVLESAGVDITGPGSSRRESGDIVCVGSLSGYRNCDTLIRAFGVYLSAGGRGRLVIRGTAGSPNAERKLRQLASYYGSSIVLSPGHLSRVQVVQAFATARIAVFPARVEASPITVLEAQACGCVVVASDIAGHREVMHPTTAAVWIDPTDPRSLAEGLLHADRIRFTSSDSRLQSMTVREDLRASWRAEMGSALQEAVQPRR